MDKYLKLEEGSKEDKMHQNLMKQVTKVFKHCNQLSKDSRYDYIARVSHFAKFEASVYHKQSLNNIKNDHITAYVEQCQEAQLSSSYIGSILSAIRFFVDQNGKDSSYILSNKELGYEPRTQAERIGDNKAWSSEQVKHMQELAVQKGNPQITDMIRLARGFGLRIHEVTRLERIDLQRAIKNEFLHVKGKGGLERDVPLRNDENRMFIQKLINQTPRENWKVFVPDRSQRTDLVIKQVQNFIANNKQAGDTITAHGLRHTWAQERYKELQYSGMKSIDAKLQVSLELGHFRPDITSVYLQER